ncbi:hypothetical protein [Streptomyces sp. URMC 129]|uniref:hypothetical protein n=1 Tax=Streptomyces sp. URMC 129 TaxID=3423407 RepID=UPI003F1A1B0E
MTNPHPEPAEIAALEEDLLPRADAARLHAHLTDCASCAQIRADLTTLREELATFPDPGPLPDDIAIRIDAALSDAAASSVTRAVVSRGTTPEPPEAPIVVSRTAISRGTTPVPPEAPIVVSRETGRGRRLRFALVAVGALVGLGLGAAVLQTLDTGGGASSEETRADEAAEAPAEVLEADVRELLAQVEDTPDLTAESADGTPVPESQGFPESTELAAPVVPSCVEAAIGRQDVPLAAEEEEYEGVDAYLVVFPTAADPGQVDAYLVDARCVGSSSPASGEVLLQESYPRD